MCACSKSASTDPKRAVCGDGKPMRNEIEEGKGCVRIPLTSKQCTITTNALLFYTYLLITCSDGLCVYFLGCYFKIQAGENHSSASREMIDMGAFLVMYKNVLLIAAHSCSGAYWKIPSPSASSRSPVVGQCVPPPT